MVPAVKPGKKAVFVCECQLVLCEKKMKAEQVLLGPLIMAEYLPLYGSPVITYCGDALQNPSVSAAGTVFNPQAAAFWDPGPLQFRFY